MTFPDRTINPANSHAEPTCLTESVVNGPRERSVGAIYWQRQRQRLLSNLLNFEKCAGVGDVHLMNLVLLRWDERRSSESDNDLPDAMALELGLATDDFVVTTRAKAANAE